jgi:thioredoxin 1
MSLDITKSDLAEKIKTKEIIFLDFYASWCGPCVNFKPIYEKVAAETTEALFYTVNVDIQRDIAIEYRISSIPTIICIKDGSVCWSHTGSMNEDTFKENIKKCFKSSSI